MDVAIVIQGVVRSLTKNWRNSAGSRQDIEIYSDPKFAEVLENWAVDSAWKEIQFLLGNRKGKVLDIACGSGRAQSFLSRFNQLEYYGCDISQLLIDKAVERGISPANVSVQDATTLRYGDKSFDYTFSIGSLEHFTIDGLRSVIAESDRVCSGLSFHQVPVSRSGFDEGWITPYQSYWNNSVEWWLEKFSVQFGKDVWTMDSHWGDRQSRGAWFICGKTDWFAAK
jgi:ubiquinone/menaquinone biosynthesis C-methylase UbiE